MYKFLLCWRYLLTRYIALISIVSVMLGVTIMIVTNAVMLGFATEMENRIHGILADITFQSHDLNKGFPDYEWHRELILEAAGGLIEELTPVVYTMGMITYRANGTGDPVCMPVDIFGIDPKTQCKVSEIAKYLQHPENRKALSFDLRQGGYDVIGSGRKEDAPHRFAMSYAGWKYRQSRAEQEKRRREMFEAAQSDAPPQNGLPEDPFQSLPQQEPNIFDPAKHQHNGIVIGIGISLFQREKQFDKETGKEIVVDDLLLLPGDDVMLTFPTSDLRTQIKNDSFTVVDLYESKMVEYDRKLVFVPIERLQRLRGMVDADTGKYTLTQILIKVKPGANLNEVRDRLRRVFPPQLFSIKTWRDEQAMLLSAVFNELAMLNVILFLILAVAGFGILAIFYMIVTEKQKDIGILKALGAGSGGIMQIFLYYSLLLGIVGSSLGLGLGLLIIKYVREIAHVLSVILGSEVFSPEIYSFYEIPTAVHVPTVIGIMIGAVVIAVTAGVLPALRAARVQPVESLRS
jgi:lipoprotein-releasing system permease protein